MGKAEEAAAKRRAKSNRKRVRRSSTVSEARQAHIAAKQRRKNGTRRICQGMCYTLPTPDDPFNDRCPGRGKKKRKVEEQNEEFEVFEGEKSRALERQEQLTSGSEESSSDHDEDVGQNLVSKVPVSYKLIVEALLQDEAEKKSLWSDPTRFQKEFWEACVKGLNILGTVGDMPRLAYLPAAACHVLKKGSSKTFSVLLIVASEEEARAVRRMCVPLQASFGIRTVSIHTGRPIEDQLSGLEKLPTFEILVATPERLCELQKRNAIDMSRASLIVVENAEALISKGFSSTMTMIKSQASPTAQFVLMSTSFSEASIFLARQFLNDPITRVSAGESLKDKAACISQEVSVIAHSSRKLPKLLSIISRLRKEDRFMPTLILVSKNEDPRQLASCITSVKVGSLVDFKDSVSARQFRQGTLEALVTREEMLGLIDLSMVQALIHYSFPSSMKTYCELLTSIGRKSAHSLVHSFCDCFTAPLSARLVAVLQQCSQPVPKALELLAKAAAVI